MKARIKATGEIVEVSPYWTEIHTTNGGCYEMTEVDLIYDAPDYWTRLEHTYAGMAMQGILSGDSIMERIAKFKVEDLPSLVADLSIQCAHALVEKLKEKEERK